MQAIRRPANGSYIPYIKGYNFIKEENGEFVYVPDEAVREGYAKLEGQINRTTDFGSAIYMLARFGPADWLEVGSWNGKGSTQCILDGFAERADNGGRLASYELDPLMMGVAQKNLEKHVAIKKVQFIMDRLVLPTGSAPFTINVPESEKSGGHYIHHYDRERVLYEEAKGTPPPFAPQVALLDGGEFTGYADWLNLDKSRLLYILLDDTRCMKNAMVRKELLSNPLWSCVEDSASRNGWAIFKKVT